MNILTETGFGHGAEHIQPIHRKFRRFLRRNAAGSEAPFNWAVGTDVRNKVGPVPIKNQGQSFSCGRQAGANAQYILRALDGINEGEISAKSGYGRYCGDGGGMTITSLTTDIGAYGANLESAVPSYQNGNAPSENFMEDRSWESATLDTDALKRAGYTPVNVDIDMDSIASAIDTYGFVIFELQGQNNGTWYSQYPQPPQRSNPNPIWGHYMIVVAAGQKNGINQLTALQSWGKSVGNQGEQYFTENYIDSGFIVDAITFISDKKVKPLLTLQDTWANICRYFRLSWGLS